jgi:putative acetyltransferase
MDYQIRRARAADAIDIRNVHSESVDKLGAHAYDDEQIKRWAQPRDPADYPIEERGVYSVVAEQDDGVIGFGWMRVEAEEYLETEGEITAVYIHPDVVREGIGSRIYGELERHARQHRVESLGLWASLNAVPFYEARGYDTIAERTLQYEEVSMPVVEMHKRLAYPEE